MPDGIWATNSARLQPPRLRSARIARPSMRAKNWSCGDPGRARTMSLTSSFSQDHTGHSPGAGEHRSLTTQGTYGQGLRQVVRYSTARAGDFRVDGRARLAGFWEGVDSTKHPVCVLVVVLPAHDLGPEDALFVEVQR